MFVIEMVDRSGVAWLGFVRKVKVDGDSAQAPEEEDPSYGGR